MIRKWSYLTDTQDLNVSASLTAMSKCYSFKVFRMTTRFKKYQRNETFFVRKQDSSRKRQTSWLTLLGIFAQWSLQYIQSRQLLRYHQSRGLYVYQLIVPNVFVIQKKINLFNPQLTFVTSTITSKWYNTIKKSTKINYNRSISLTTLMTDNISNSVLKDTNTSGLIIDNQRFVENQELLSLQNQTTQTLNQLGYMSSIPYITNFYKVMILLTLFNTK